jgi:hypothetical protein
VGASGTLPEQLEDMRSIDCMRSGKWRKKKYLLMVMALGGRSWTPYLPFSGVVRNPVFDLATRGKEGSGRFALG